MLSHQRRRSRGRGGNRPASIAAGSQLAALGATGREELVAIDVGLDLRRREATGVDQPSVNAKRGESRADVVRLVSFGVERCQNVNG